MRPHTRAECHNHQQQQQPEQQQLQQQLQQPHQQQHDGCINCLSHPEAMSTSAAAAASASHLGCNAAAAAAKVDLDDDDDDVDLDDFFGDDSEEDEVKKKMVDDDSSLFVVPAASSQDYRSVTCLGNSKKLILMKFNTLSCSWMERPCSLLSWKLYMFDQQTSKFADSVTLPRPPP